MRKAGFDIGEIDSFFDTTRKPIKKKGKHDSLYFENGLVDVKYRNNTIARVVPYTKTIKISSAGWRTNTTKTRLNKLLSGTKQGGHITQKNYSWFYQSRKGKRVPFKEGLTFRF